MTWRRKLYFSLLTVALLVGILEGVARIIWWRIETSALASTKVAGEEVLRNDAIAFMKEPDGVYGYVLKPNFSSGNTFINEDRFPQRERIPIERQPGKLRVVCMGESTTFGNNVESNYPFFLRSILKAEAVGYDDYEVINAGVPGWVSDQVALRAERQLAQYRPDVVILYVGWNDFQSYDPLGSLDPVSYFDKAYRGNEWKQYATSWSKTLALLSALYHRGAGNEAQPSLAPAKDAPPEMRYRFLLASYDRVLSAYRRTNPDVKVFLSTVAGRWPIGTPEEWAKIPTVWWMAEHKLTPVESAMFVARFNDTLRRYAARHGLSLIDTATAFEALDRARLQFDWAHMHSDGYELVAWTMFDALVDAGVVGRSGAAARHATLLEQYAMRSADTRIASSQESQ